MKKMIARLILGLWATLIPGTLFTLLAITLTPGEMAGLVMMLVVVFSVVTSFIWACDTLAGFDSPVTRFVSSFFNTPPPVEKPLDAKPPLAKSEGPSYSVIAENTESIHMCKACGCLWRVWKNGGGCSLADHNQHAGPCCDNSPEFASLLSPAPDWL